LTVYNIPGLEVRVKVMMIVIPLHLFLALAPAILSEAISILFLCNSQSLLRPALVLAPVIYSLLIIHKLASRECCAVRLSKEMVVNL
jgi:hypothetical protein